MCAGGVSAPAGHQRRARHATPRGEEMKRVLSALAALAALVLALSPSASAHGSYTCTTDIFSTTIDQNVVVPDGATCGLTDVTVNGNISVGNNAALLAVGTTVNGNVKVGSNSVADLHFGGTVNGNLSIGSGSAAIIVGYTVNGNYSARDASSAFNGSSLAKSVTITGGTYVFSINTIGKNLTCHGGATGILNLTSVGGHNNGCTV
jgi:hypothetical protein